MSNIKTMATALAMAALGLLGACSPSATWTGYNYKAHHFAQVHHRRIRRGAGPASADCRQRLIVERIKQLHGKRLKIPDIAGDDSKIMN